MPETRGLLKSGRIASHFEARVVEITPTHVRLDVAGRPTAIEADFVLLMTGYVQDNALLKTAGVPLDGDQQRPVYDPETMQTHTLGLYVAGTAVGGTQDHYRVFIENCHDHVDKIVRHAFGEAAVVNRVTADLPES